VLDGGVLVIGHGGCFTERMSSEKGCSSVHLVQSPQGRRCKRIIRILLRIDWSDVNVLLGYGSSRSGDARLEVWSLSGSLSPGPDFTANRVSPRHLATVDVL
jgi:hypothetical protein